MWSYRALPQDQIALCTTDDTFLARGCGNIFNEYGMDYSLHSAKHGNAAICSV